MKAEYAKNPIYFIQRYCNQLLIFFNDSNDLSLLAKKLSEASDMALTRIWSICLKSREVIFKNKSAVIVWIHLEKQRQKDR